MRLSSIGAEKIAEIADRGFPESLFQLQTAVQLSERAGVEINCDGAVIHGAAWLNPRQMVQNTAQFLQRQGVKIVTKQLLIVCNMIKGNGHCSAMNSSSNIKRW